MHDNSSILVNQEVDAFTELVQSDSTLLADQDVAAFLSEELQDVKLTLLLKNVTSLLHEDRESQVFAELTTVRWDVVALNETWRETKEETWTIAGHLFLGSGGSKGSNGVAVILHRRWAKGFQSFKAVSDRVCSVDVNINERRLRFIAVYMPTAWHPEAAADGVYTELTGLYCEARRLKRTVILLGDFNAGKTRPGK